MSEGDLDSSILDDMLFGSGFLPDPSCSQNRDNIVECVPQQDEISGHDPPYPKMVEVISSKYIPHQSELSDLGTYCITRHNKSKMQISAVGSEVSCKNYGSSSFPELRGHEAIDVNSSLIKGRKFDDFKSTQRQERQLKSQKSCQKDVMISESELGPTRELIQGLESNSFNNNSNRHPAPEIENEVDLQSFNLFYTCPGELNNGDQLTANNFFETCKELSVSDEVENKITPGDMKKSDAASNIPQERKEDSSFVQDNNMPISHGNEESDSITRSSSLYDGKTSTPSDHVSTKETNAASSMDGSSLNADSLYDDDDDEIQSEVDYFVSDDLAADSEECVKERTHMITKDNTVTVNALMIPVKGGTDEKPRNLDNSLHSNQSNAADNTQVKELSDSYEMSIVNEDYLPQLNWHERQINRSSINQQDQNVFSDPNSVVNLRVHHPNTPDLSVSYGLGNDIRNIGIETSQSIPEHKLSATLLQSLNAVEGPSLQLQEINYAYLQNENGYTLEKYILPAVSQQGADRLLVGDTERSMEGLFGSSTEIQRNGRSEESIIHELANEFKHVRVEAFNTRDRVTDLPINEHFDPDLGGPDESSLHQTHGIEGTAHQLNLENSSLSSQDKKTQAIIPSAEGTLPVHISDTQQIPGVPIAGSSYWANNISGEISLPVQEDHNRSASYESLHRERERPSFFRQISCPSPQEISRISSDEQRDREYALELQQQFNHEIVIEDEILARHLDNSQHQVLDPSGNSSRRTEFFGSQADERISQNPQRRQYRQQHSNRFPGRQRIVTAANRNRQSNREESPEDMISLHENSSHTLRSHDSSQGNMQGVMQQRGNLAGANVADSRMPLDSIFQSVRQHGGRASDSNSPGPHRFEPVPVERAERIPGQSAQIDPNVITPLTRNYQENRRRHEEQRRQSQARLWIHQYHHRQPNWRRDLDLPLNEDYPSLDVHPSYFDPDEVFEMEDGEQFVSITQDPFTLGRFIRTRRPSFELPNRDSYNELWNLVEMLGEVRQQGLDQARIEMLPVHTFHEGNSTNSKECNICLSAYSNGDEIRTLTCLHMFHTACIDEWLNRNAVCPVCRRRIEFEDSSQ